MALSLGKKPIIERESNIAATKKKRKKIPHRLSLEQKEKTKLIISKPSAGHMQLFVVVQTTKCCTNSSCLAWAVDLQLASAYDSRMGMQH